MSDINTGGAAFPIALLEGQTLADSSPSGITQRDYFAAQAMQALINVFYARNQPFFSLDELATSAYANADAMLRAQTAS